MSPTYVPRPCTRGRSFLGFTAFPTIWVPARASDFDSRTTVPLEDDKLMLFRSEKFSNIKPLFVSPITPSSDSAVLILVVLLVFEWLQRVQTTLWQMANKATQSRIRSTTKRTTTVSFQTRQEPSSW